MKRVALKCLFVLLALVPFAVSAQTATTAISDKQLNILTLGDSNGTFAFSWPVQLKAALPNAQINNISKSGRTIGFLNNGDSTLNSLAVIDLNLKKAADMTGTKPYDFIVMEIGTNDGKAVYAARQAEIPGNLEKLIHKIKDCPNPVISKAKIILISPPPYGSKAESTEKYAGGNARMKALNDTFKTLAKKTGCLYISGYTIPGMDMETMSADGLHMDAVASRKLIEPVVALMIK